MRIDMKPRNAMCPKCQEEVIWLSGAEAAKVSDLSEREVFRLAEGGEIHFAESEAGMFIVCQRSLGARR